MKKLIYGQDERVMRFVCERTGSPGWIGATTIGYEKDGELIAGVVFESYSHPNIHIHVAAVPGTRWVTKEFMFAVFKYPFLQLKCARVTGVVEANNTHALAFDKHLGFVEEGRLRCGAKDGGDLIVLGMLPNECKFLRPNWR
jgi:RimJ/RimL family protein N-acetyltransferase